MEAVGADERWLNLKVQMLLLHVTLVLEGGDWQRDMRIAIPFVLVTLGDETMKECLELDVGRLVNEEFLRLGNIALGKRCSVPFPLRRVCIKRDICASGWQSLLRLEFWSVHRDSFLTVTLTDSVVGRRRKKGVWRGKVVLRKEKSRHVGLMGGGKEDCV